MSRRRFLHLTRAAATGVLLTACDPAEKEKSPMGADEILSAAGLTTPDLETTVIDAPLEGTEKWSNVVTFSGPSDEVEAWVTDNYPNGIGSTAYKDDMAEYVERLGTGVQKEGDRIASGSDGAITTLVVVGQGETPEVHVVVRRTGR